MTGAAAETSSGDEGLLKGQLGEAQGLGEAWASFSSRAREQPGSAGTRAGAASHQMPGR